MNPPRDHHFIPVFYLKRWAAENGKVVEYTRRYKNLSIKTVGPKGTGFQTDLYSFPELPVQERHIVESRFFNATDQLASDALNHLYAGKTSWTAELRSAWSRFLLNLRIRHPDPLQELRTHINTTWNKSDEYYEREYQKVRSPDKPATLVEYMESLGNEAGQKVQMRLLLGVLDLQKTGQKINEMEWTVLDLSASPFPLLTSDWSVELSLAKGVVSLPIGPNRLFLATRDLSLQRQIKSVSSKKLVASINTYVVSGARRYVYGRDKTQTPFIEKHMSRNMAPPPFWPTLGSTHVEKLEAMK